MKRRRDHSEDQGMDYPDLSEARNARVQSEQAAASARRDWVKVRVATDHLREHRMRNGFSELLIQTMRDVR